MKPENCKTELEYWLYNIANMDKMRNSVQFIDKSPALSRLGEVARYHVLTRAEQERYMKEYDDYVVLKDAMTTKYKEGAEKGEKRGFQSGMAQGRMDQLVENIKNLMASGFDYDKVVEMLKISADQIDMLKKMGLP